MQNTSYVTARDSILDDKPSVSVEYVVRQCQRPVKLFTFDSSDNSNIHEGRKPFVMTCSRMNYPELRLKFAQGLGHFVARLNMGANGDRSRALRDKLMNPHNKPFRDILEGKLGEDTQVFIIPLKKNLRNCPEGKEWIPTCGIKFVNDSYGYWADLGTETLNLVSGDSRPSYRYAYIDEYHQEPSRNEYAVEAISL